MATPIVEQIAVKIRTRLLAITTGNGYETTVAQVIRPTRIDESSPADYQIHLTQETETLNQVFPGEPARHEYKQPFRIALGLRPSEKSTTPLDTYRNTFHADVKKALSQAGSGDWTQWDGLAVRSVPGSAEWFLDSDGATSGVQMILDVYYRVYENDPYTNAG